MAPKTVHNAQSIVREIQGSALFLKARGTSVALDVRKNMATQIVVQLRSLGGLSAVEAAGIANALDGAPFGDHTALVARALDEVVAATNATSAKVGPGKTQHLYHFFNYASQKDWDIFRSKDVTILSKMERAVQRLNRVG